MLSIKRSFANRDGSEVFFYASSFLFPFMGDWTKFDRKKKTWFRVKTTDRANDTSQCYNGSTNRRLHWRSEFKHFSTSRAEKRASRIFRKNFAVDHCIVDLRNSKNCSGWSKRHGAKLRESFCPAAASHSRPRQAGA